MLETKSFQVILLSETDWGQNIVPASEKASWIRAVVSTYRSNVCSLKKTVPFCCQQKPQLWALAELPGLPFNGSPLHRHLSMAKKTAHA